MGISLSHQRSQTLSLWLITVILLLYPLFGTLVAFTSYPSQMVSIPIRGLAVLISLALIKLNADRSRLNNLQMVLVTFWLIYSIRLIWDMGVADISGADMALFFFLFACLLPSVSIFNIKHYNERNISQLLLIFGILTCLAAIAAANFDFVQIKRNLMDESEGRLFLETVNPITFGHVAVTTLIAALSLFRFKGTWFGHSLIPLGIILAAYLLILSGSRGPAVTLIVCLFILALSQRQYRTFIFIAIIPLAYILNFTSSGSDILLFSRFYDTLAGRSEEIRLVQQANAIQQFIENPVFGSAYIELVFQEYPHNPIIESAMASGVLGLLLFVVITLSAFMRIFQLLRSGFILIPLIALQYIIAAQFSGSLYLSNSMWLGIALIFSMDIVSPQSNVNLQPV